MNNVKIGRVLGIGVRIAGKVASERLLGEAAPQQARAAQNPPVAAPQPPTLQAQGQNAARQAKNVGKAAKQGASGFFRAFGRAGSIVWLQVTGCFFLLPVLAFTPKLWQTRMNWRSGPDHSTFLVTALFVVVFLYLGVSSFWRAGRK